MFAPESRARLFLMIAILLAATFGALTWRGIRDERQRVAFRSCFYADDAARLLQTRIRLHLEAMAAPLFAAVGGRAPVGPTETLPPLAVLKTVDQALAKCHCAPRLSTQAYFRLDLDASGAVSRLAIERADWPAGRSSGDAARQYVRHSPDRAVCSACSVCCRHGAGRADVAARGRGREIRDDRTALHAPIRSRHRGIERDPLATLAVAISRLRDPRAVGVVLRTRRTDQRRGD
jgi:hypothetical protein